MPINQLDKWKAHRDEIDRLRALNAELVAALEDLANYVDTEMVHPPRVVARATELISKARSAP